MPYQLDWQLRAPYPDSPDGYYYWTNSWILNASTDGQAITRANQVGNWVAANTTTVCQRVRRTFKRSPGMGGVYFNQTTSNVPGTYPAGTAGYSLLMTVRIEFLVAGALVGYKRWRMPLRLDQVDGSLLDPALITHMQTGLNLLMLQGTLVTRSNVTIRDYRIVPEVRMWQLRHGTKRRERVVIA